VVAEGELESPTSGL